MQTQSYNQKYFKDRDLLDLHLAEAIKFLMNKHKLRSVLDVGCGTGRLVNYLNDQGFQSIGIDPSKQAITLARKENKQSILQQASATNLPFKKNSFDIITSISVIEHLPKKAEKKFISEIKRILKSKGIIFLVTPNFSAPWRYIQGNRWFGYSDPTHRHFYTRKELSFLLTQQNFHNITFEFKTIYNPPYQWQLPGLYELLPKPVKSLTTYLLISTPLSAIRDSFLDSCSKILKTKRSHNDSDNRHNQTRPLFSQARS